MTISKNKSSNSSSSSKASRPATAAVSLPNPNPNPKLRGSEPESDPTGEGRGKEKGNIYEGGVCYDPLLDSHLEKRALGVPTAKTRNRNRFPRTIIAKYSARDFDWAADANPEAEEASADFYQKNGSGNGTGNARRDKRERERERGSEKVKVLAQYLMVLCQNELILFRRAEQSPNWTVAQAELYHPYLDGLQIPAKMLNGHSSYSHPLQIVMPISTPPHYRYSESSAATTANNVNQHQHQHQHSSPDTITTSTSKIITDSGAGGGERSNILELEIEPIGEFTAHLWERSWRLLEQEGLIELELRSPNNDATRDYLNDIRQLLTRDSTVGNIATKTTGASSTTELLTAGKSLLTMVESFISQPPRQMSSADRCLAQLDFLWGLSDGELKLYRATRAGRDYALLKIIRAQTESSINFTFNYWFDSSDTCQAWLKKLQDWMPAWEWQTLQLLAYHNLNNLI